MNHRSCLAVLSAAMLIFAGADLFAQDSLLVLVSTY